MLIILPIACVFLKDMKSSCPVHAWRNSHGGVKQEPSFSRKNPIMDRQYSCSEKTQASRSREQKTFWRNGTVKERGTALSLFGLFTSNRVLNKEPVKSQQWNGSAMWAMESGDILKAVAAYARRWI